MPEKKPQTPFLSILRIRRFLILSIASLIVIAILAFVVVVPRVQSILTLRDDITSQQHTLDTLQNKERFLESFKNAEFDALNEKLQRILPSTKPFLQTLASLEQLSLQENVIFAGLDVNPGEIASSSAVVSPKDAHSDLQKMELKMKIDGTSAQINSFINKVTTIAPALDVKAFSSTVQPGLDAAALGANTSYEADVDLTALYAPILVSKDSGAGLPPLTKAENDYATSTLSTYVLFPETTLVAPNPADLGKPDPFSQQ
ncbi:MAG TPA: hypothetical protein VFG51_02810 [Candidatus Saccharimonadia bacterium]|nr:hypothetical protein [Candidatus Saccharimonadia bacterium]